RRTSPSGYTTVRGPGPLVGKSSDRASTGIGVRYGAGAGEVGGGSVTGGRVGRATTGSSPAWPPPTSSPSVEPAHWSNSPAPTTSAASTTATSVSSRQRPRRERAEAGGEGWGPGDRTGVVADRDAVVEARG